MRHWSQIAIRNWRAKPGRTAGAVMAIALGVGVVVWVTSSYASVHQAIEQQVWTWIGESDLTVESMLGYRGTIRQETAEHLAKFDDLIGTMTARYVPRMMASRDPIGAGATFMGLLDAVECDVHGIQPATEYAFRDYAQMLQAGRLLTAEDVGKCLIEDTLAERLGLGLGETVYIRLPLDSTNPMYEHQRVPDGPHGFQIVGTIRNRRLARFQPPMLVAQLSEIQPLAPLAADDGARVTSIDMKLKDREILARRREAARVLRPVRVVVEKYGGMMAVLATAEAKLRQVREAQQQTQMILMLLASVALFTAFFIILTTMSMGMIERVTQMGLLRCLGVTRGQMGLMVVAEIIPMGVLGILLGIPIGLGLARAAVAVVPEYLGQFTIDWPGIGLAVAGGGLTTLLGGALPALHALRVSPLDATRPQAKPVHWIGELLAAVVGIGMIAAHMHMIETYGLAEWLRPESPVMAVMLIYCGYALTVPLLIRLVSYVAVHAAALVVRIRPKLLHDQIGRATWRSAGICCGLMVGLSLIVCVVVNTESMIAGWDFGSQLAEAFVWDRTEGVPAERAENILAAVQLNHALKARPEAVNELATQSEPRRQFKRALDGARKNIPPEWVEAAQFVKASNQFPSVSLERLEHIARLATTVTGIGEITQVNQIQGAVANPKSRFSWGVFTSYIVGDPDTFFDMARVKFVDCQRDEVLALMRKGGYVLITSEFARSRETEIGDKVNFTVGGGLMGGILGLGGKRRVTFEVAGIVDAPALHIAANYFHADGQLTFAASNSIFGTLADAKRLLNNDRIRMFLLDFGLSDEPPPADFAERPVSQLLADLGGGGLALANPADMDDVQRWHWYREQQVLRNIAKAAGISNPIWGSVQALKQALEDEIRDATLLVTTIPTIALIVAALGVGNLMMANVNSRAREIAVMRAVGATQWQIMRLVMAEAVVLGGLGSAVGVALGLQMASGIQSLVFRIYSTEPSFTIPWPKVLVGIALTTGICLIAGLLPARHAARSNIAGALQTT